MWVGMLEGQKHYISMSENSTPSGQNKRIQRIYVVAFLAHLSTVLMVSYCGQSMSVVHHAASTIALKAYSSYIPGPIDDTW